MTNKKKIEKEQATFKFSSKDFYDLLEKCQKKCSLTGRTLSPLTAEIELREPYKQEGIEEIDNHYFVHKTVSYLARYVSEEEIIEVAADIIRFRGAERGYALSKNKIQHEKRKYR
ncbi:hypothetical protein [Leptospira noguchii]|uniref:Uncharacterized protein n=1 Tax=Leptospira noguchii serovar Panama str. CZ214 TaxID=1001595 RepID=T0GLR7_9LEPT|nr:hypothetical protein [Leptospira noguchii]EQA69822.1 hypothetical protein LEP1GSC059_1962 [Leptospira noguchii serovar Panama str. CZ214]